MFNIDLRAVHVKTRAVGKKDLNQHTDYTLLLTTPKSCGFAGTLSKVIYTPMKREHALFIFSYVDMIIFIITSYKLQMSAGCCLS